MSNEYRNPKQYYPRHEIAAMSALFMHAMVFKRGSVSPNDTATAVTMAERLLDEIERRERAFEDREANTAERTA